MRTSIAVPFLLFVSSVGGVALAQSAAARPAAARERPVMERVNPAHREAGGGAERARAFRAERPVMAEKNVAAERPSFSGHGLKPQVAAAVAKAAPVVHLESAGGPKGSGNGQQGSGQGGSGQQGSGQQGTATTSKSHTEHQLACQPGSPSCGANRSDGKPLSAAKRVYSEEEARAVVQFAGTAAAKASERGKEILKTFMKKAMCARVGGDACG